MDEIMSGQATPVQMAAYLTALSMKGETIDEIKDQMKELEGNYPMSLWLALVEDLMRLDLFITLFNIQK